MSVRGLLVVVGSSFFATSILFACASDEEGGPALLPDATVVPEPDARAVEAGDDARDGGEACTTDDCAFFPSDCTPDVLCQIGLFDRTDPSVGLDARTRIEAIAGRSTSDAWVVGTLGTAAHFDGTSWTLADLGTAENLRFLWLVDAGELTFGTPNRLYTRRLGSSDGGVTKDGWAVRELAPPSGYDGTFVTTTWAAPGSNRLWVATPNDLWRAEVSGSTISTRPAIPSSVCMNALCQWLRSIHGATSGTVWAVGDNGAAIRITNADGDAPVFEVTNALSWKRLTGVWAASDTEAWAVGIDGTILHDRDARSVWELVAGVPTGEQLNAVTGSSPSDVWAVGNAGVVLHFDGTTWSRLKLAGLGARRPDLYTVWSPRPGQVWIGGLGVVLTLGGKP